MAFCLFELFSNGTETMYTVTDRHTPPWSLSWLDCGALINVDAYQTVKYSWLHFSIKNWASVSNFLFLELLIFLYQYHI